MYKTILILLATAALLSAACAHHSRAAARTGEHLQASRSTERGSDDSQFVAQEEINRNFKLAAGAEIIINGINGSVDVVTSEGDQGELHLVRSAKRKEDLEAAKITLEQSLTSLVVRVNNNGSQSLWSMLAPRPEERQRLTLKLPRQVQLRASGVNGRVNLGEIEGAVRVDGVNGRVVIAKATGLARFSGINGNVEAGLGKLSEEGLRVNGINGNVELRFAEDVNAKLDVSGINGSVRAELPNVQVQGKPDRSNYHALIGSGGAPIRVSGMNGNLMLTRAAKVSSAPNQPKAFAQVKTEIATTIQRAARWKYRKLGQLLNPKPVMG